jgi:photosystem II stability/assembly factor-like uncharacterized protein
MRLPYRLEEVRIALVAAGLAIMLLCGCGAKKAATIPALPQAPATQPSASTGPQWREVSTPFPAADITAVGNVFWVCGVDEMIASSSDGGNTWKLKHQTRAGKILLHIAFVNEKVGYAAGKGGLLLSTTDGGKMWKAHNAPGDVLAFSFADSNNGIAAIGAEIDVNRSWGSLRFPSPMQAVVKLTHDGGEHWEDIPVLSGDEFRPFTRVVAVAALDAAHYLMILNEGMVEDAFVVTQDAGKSWKMVHQRNDTTNREFAKRVFVRNGEYWVFGTQLVNRESGGGSMASMTRHSKDGETWIAGISAESDMGDCNAQGCYLWDGAVESMYGAPAQYWALPQDGSLSGTWAIAGDRACTINTIIQCAPAVRTDKPQPPRRNLPLSPGQPFKVANLPFATDCVACGVKVIRLDPGKNWKVRVVVTFAVDQEGAVTELSEDGAPEGPLGALIEEQVKVWRFRAPANAATAMSQQRHVPIDVKCVDAADVPTMDGCQLVPGNGPA